MTNISRSRRRAGFSLVEVTIAIGIVAFAFISIIGMLPVGLSSFNDAIDSTVTSQISQRLFSEAQQVRYADLNRVAVTRYYDAEGLEVGRGSAPPAPGYVYSARVQLTPGGYTQNSHVSTVTIEIAKNRVVDDTIAKNRLLVRRYNFLVADVGL